MASVADASELASIHPEPDEESIPQVHRRGPVITWAIENFSHWHATKENDNLTSGQFAVADGTHWRIGLTPTLEPVLVRDSIGKEPTRITVGFQFSLLTDTQEHFHSEPSTQTFLEGSRHAGDWSPDADDLFENKDDFLLHDTLTLQCHLWRDNPRLPSTSYVTIKVPTYKCSENYWFTLFKREKSNSSSSSFDSPKSHDSPSHEESLDHSLGLFYTTFKETGEATLQMKARKNHSFTVKCRWTMLDTAGRLTDKQSGIILDHFEEEGQFGGHPWIIEREYLLQRKKNLLRDKTDVQIQWNGVYSFANYELKFLSHERHYTRTHRLRVGSSLSTDMGRLLSASDGCPGDMNVVSGDGLTLRVHRDVLCARSDVFSAMMERDMLERQSGQVRIPDIMETTLKQLVSFLYTGRLENEPKMDCDTLVGLYAAGEKYGVVSLKKRCSALLRARVSVDNTCDLLEFSDLYSDPELRGRALDVISKRVEILVSEDWLQLTHRRGKMADEALDVVRLLRRRN